jgi:hypothetical protein
MEATLTQRAYVYDTQHFRVQPVHALVIIGLKLDLEEKRDSHDPVPKRH